MPDDAGVSIPALLAATVERHGDQAAVVDLDSRLTWSELQERARTFGAALVASGVAVGDRVALWAPNSAEWIVAVHGLFQAGATLVPVNTRFKGAEAADILGRSRARALVTVTDFLDTDYLALLRGAGADLPELRTVVVARGPVPEGDRGGDGGPGRGGDGGPGRGSDGGPEVLAWDDALARATDAGRAEVARRAAALGPDDPSDILFTSGTTGTPKGVVMTHGRTLCVATDWVAMTGLAAGDRYLMVNPYFHMFGLKAGILAATAAGATMLPEPVFDPGRVLERVAAEGITVLPGAPTIYQTILDHPDRDRHDLSSLRVAVTGAADIPVTLIERIIDELPFTTVVSGYGLTEAGTASATTPGGAGEPADPPEIIATTVGRARPGFEIRIVDGDRDAATGETGEVLLRGPSVMAGYLDDPDATAEALPDDGWLRTGDLGTLDEAGNLRIVGRKKDMFIVGGFNAYPAEIEGHLLRHPEVRQAAVIGVPDDRLGEVGMAFVVTRSGDPAVGPEILAWCRDEIANYKVPRTIEVVDELPINATGKVEKNVLRERAAERRTMTS